MTAKECCKTCDHHHAVLLRVDIIEGEECPVFEHFCDGRQIHGSTASDFRCGNYTPRGSSCQ